MRQRHGLGSDSVRAAQRPVMRSASSPLRARDGGSPARDRTWASDLRAALWCASGLLALILLVDFGKGTLTPLRLLYWTAVALVFPALLCPPRVTACGHRLVSRGLLRTRTVRTDLLVRVVCHDTMAPRLLLHDALGGRVEVDLKVLTANPLLWHHVDQGVRRSRASGLLRGGTASLQALADRIDGAGARAVFEASGMDAPRPGPKTDRP
ncbi:hypothetical protein [Streptomyces gilvosporeus]|nr:hypothetical protein [Streptomyces gilvosporeus]